MSGVDWEIGALEPSENSAFIPIVNQAFASTFQSLLGFVPPGKKEGDRLSQRLHRPGCRVFAVRDRAGDVQGGLFFQEAGTRSFAGPLALAPEWQRPWREGIALALVRSLTEFAAARGCGVIDSVTFPHSPGHFQLYYTAGEPVFTSPFLVGRIKECPEPRMEVERHKSCGPDRRRQLEEGARATTFALWEGYDLTSDIRHVADRGLGEILYCVEGDRVLGVAVLHFGPGSEAFADPLLLVKHLVVRPGAPDPGRVFGALLDEATRLGRAEGLEAIGAMVSSARRASLEALVERRWQIKEMHQQMFWMPGVSPRILHQTAIDSFRSEQFALAEWR